MQRMPMIEEQTDDPVLQSVFEPLRARFGRVLNIYRILGWSPPLARAWAAFASALRLEVGASRRLRELLIVRIAAINGARYELEHHLRMASAEGITAEQITALPAWRESGLFSADERLVLALADELAHEGRATPDTLTALQTRFSRQHTVELLVTGCFYCGVAALACSLELEHESDLA